MSDDPKDTAQIVPYYSFDLLLRKNLSLMLINDTTTFGGCTTCSTQADSRRRRLFSGAEESGVLLPAIQALLF